MASLILLNLTTSRIVLPLILTFIIQVNISNGQALGFESATRARLADLPKTGQGVEIEQNAKDENIKYILNRNPADGSLINKVKCYTKKDVNNRIRSLKKKQEVWRATPLEERVYILRSSLGFGFNMKKLRLLMNIISTEMGKTGREADEELGMQTWHDALDLMLIANEPEYIRNAMIVRDPLGIVAVLSPWNYPAWEILMHALPALVAGNAVIVKPSELTPLTGELVVNTLRMASDDVIPIDFVHGGEEVGEMLVNHASVDAISMTGSVATGKKIMENASKHMKRLILELGGKDPMVVFADADLEHAAEDAVHCSTVNAGQVGCSVERIYVESSVKEQFERLCIKNCQNVKAGPFDNKHSTMGPMASRVQMQRVGAQVDDAVAKGAKIIYTGDVIATDDEIAGGNYFPVMVLTDLKQDMKISQIETFGPVIALYEFDGSEEQAVELSNDTPYGLSASIYSKDIKKCERLALNIRAGQVGINALAMYTSPLPCPWVGHKQSGHGYHSGMDGYRQFSLPKSIIFQDGNGAHFNLGEDGEFKTD